MRLCFRSLQTLGWLIWAIYSTVPGYWLLIHQRVTYRRERTRSPYRILLPIWGAMLVFVLLITSPWRTVTVYQNGWTGIPAGFLFAIGFWLYKRGGANFNLR